MMPDIYLNLEPVILESDGPEEWRGGKTSQNSLYTKTDKLTSVIFV